ncbi:MAG TPA: hypothetical protein VGS58_12060 [Candidatus Sulfopaludibacter sp.]|nr:hypothetical protein [Candidatus Sulfopaludibacter sp.]
MRPLLPDGQAFLPDRRRREGSPELPHDLLFAVVERLIREKSELLEEVLQLRAAVSIYRRIAEQTTAARLAPKADAA